MKYAINKCYGGFSLSNEALRRLFEIDPKACEVTPWREYYGVTGHTKCKYSVSEEEARRKLEEDMTRTGSRIFLPLVTVGTKGNESIVSFDRYGLESRCNPALIQVIEELGEAANGGCAELKIVDVPHEPESLELDEYDGIETV